MYAPSVPVLIRLCHLGTGECLVVGLLGFLNGEWVEYRRLDSLTSVDAGAGLCGSVGRCVSLFAVVSACVIMSLSIRSVGWGCTICTVVPCQLDCYLPQYTLT